MTDDPTTPDDDAAEDGDPTVPPPSPTIFVPPEDMFVSARVRGPARFASLRDVVIRLIVDDYGARDRAEIHAALVESGETGAHATRVLNQIAAGRDGTADLIVPLEGAPNYLALTDEGARYARADLGLDRMTDKVLEFRRENAVWEAGERQWRADVKKGKRKARRSRNPKKRDRKLTRVRFECDADEADVRAQMRRLELNQEQFGKLVWRHARAVLRQYPALPPKQPEPDIDPHMVPVYSVERIAELDDAALSRHLPASATVGLPNLPEPPTPQDALRDVKRITDRVPALKLNRDALVEAVRAAGGPIVAADLRAQLGWGGHRWQTASSSLVEDGLLVRLGFGFYDLPERAKTSSRPLTNLERLLVWIAGREKRSGGVSLADAAKRFRVPRRRFKSTVWRDARTRGLIERVDEGDYRLTKAGRDAVAAARNPAAPKWRKKSGN